MRRKKWQMFLACLCTAALLGGCGVQGSNTEAPTDFEDVTEIVLSDEGTTVDGIPITEDSSEAVYAARDIVFYLAGQGFTYGAGTEADEHTQEEADAHTVIHIGKPGTYAVSGSLSAGQIAVDLGEDAGEDPEAVVTLILNNMDITCTVAPAVIFYNVYECGETDTETATKDVDTSEAGANVLIADGSYNKVQGSYVARIYKSYELNEAGTEVVDNKKLHKYDGAFYSRMSMNVDGGEEGNGVLEIAAENEGLDSELHLTINGGNIHINAGNDGINTNEDGVSVTTVNGGNLSITVTGTTGEGDGIDSNGWLVINGGTVMAYACSTSMDAGLDSDMGIHIDGGLVFTTGNMLDRIDESSQTYAVFGFAGRQEGGKTVLLKNDQGETVGDWTPVNDYSYLVVAGDILAEGTYTLWIDDVQFAGSAGGAHMGFGGGPGMGKEERPELPEGEPPQVPGQGKPPEGGTLERMERPEGEMPESPEGEMPEPPEGEMPEPPEREMPGSPAGETTAEFVITVGGNYFNIAAAAEQ